MKNKDNCPCGAGLRPAHYPELEKGPPRVIQWFEAISENYMNSWGRPRQMLHQIRKDFPVAMHGVSMSLASAEGINISYIKRLKELNDEIEPFILSDHLCWTGQKSSNVHDLLPFPFTGEALRIIVNNIDQAQSLLKRPLVIENVSSYMTFRGSEFTEWDFLVEVAQKSGAKILLDINNVYVSSQNHCFDPKLYLDSIPSNLIAQIHLAGHSDLGSFLFDTHSHPVQDQVWDLFSYFIEKNQNIPFMIEWDEDIPPLAILEEEVEKAKKIWQKYRL